MTNIFELQLLIIRNLELLLHNIKIDYKNNVKYNA